MSDERKCTYCEKGGELVEVRGMKGIYHLRCVKSAKDAWESVRSKSLLTRILERTQ